MTQPPVTMSAQELRDILAGTNKVGEDEACEETGLSRQQLRAQARRRRMKIYRSYESRQLETLINDLAARAVPEGLLGRRAAADHCGVNAETISRWVRDGKLKVAHALGRRQYFSREDLDRAVDFAGYGQRMSQAEVCELVGLRHTELWTLTSQGLFPSCNRDQRYRTSEVHAWHKAVQASSYMPFGEPEKDARFRSAMETIERKRAERKAALAAHEKWVKDQLRRDRQNLRESFKKAP